MATSDAYGRRLGERLRVENAPAIVTKTLRKAEIAFTEIRCDDPLPGMTSPVQREDAYLVGLILRDFPIVYIGRRAGKRLCATCGQAIRVSMT
jgi:hypothetical protein